jgi:hypothetical protein
MTRAITTSVGIANSHMLDKLEQRVKEIGDLHSKLLLLIGNSGKTRLLRALAQRLDTIPINIGVKLGQRLVATPVSDRGFSANELLREVTDKSPGEVPLLLDNLEVLFEPSLKINPLDCVKRLAHSRRVVAVWPGEMRDNRLVYAAMGHPEYRDTTSEGVVAFVTTQSQSGI